MEWDKTLGWIILLIIAAISVYALLQERVLERLTADKVKSEMIKEGISGAIMGFTIGAISALAVSDNREEAFALGLSGTAAGFISGLVTGVVYETIGEPVAILFTESVEKDTICKKRCFRDYMSEAEKQNCFKQCNESDNVTPAILQDDVNNYAYEPTTVVT